MTTEAKDEIPAQEEAHSILPPANEKVTGETIKHEFQTETRKILSIVAQSLYTDREVWNYMLTQSNHCINSITGFCSWIDF